MKKLVLPDIALPHLQWLVERTRLTAHLAVLEKDQAIYIQKVDGPGLIKFDTYVGKRTNLHCTAVGKVLVAYASTERQQQVLSKKSFARYTTNTITLAALLRKELMNVRQKGYAIDDEEEELDIRCLAAPVFNQAGDFMAALGLTGTSGQLRDDNIEEYAALVIDAARKIFGCSSRKRIEAAGQE
jgi:DNA-binding IclR family transcriptional regulator